MSYEDFAIVARGVAGWDSVVGVASDVTGEPKIADTILLGYFLESHVDVAIRRLSPYLAMTKGVNLAEVVSREDPWLSESGKPAVE